MAIPFSLRYGAAPARLRRAVAPLQIRDNVINEVGLVHPVIFESLNLCELSKENMKNLKVDMLRDMWIFWT